jgi:hypothetical protein
MKSAILPNGFPLLDIFFPNSFFSLVSCVPIFIMDQPYPHTREFAYQYTFVSHGKERIEKIVLFSSTPIPNLFNVGFGDLREDGTIDDRIRSNNGDIIKILSTIIDILKTFLYEHPKAKVSFAGSTPNRTVLYERILRTYYDKFSKEFIISALILENDFYKEVLFNPLSPALSPYLSFYVKLIFI